MLLCHVAQNGCVSFVFRQTGSKDCRSLRKEKCSYECTVFFTMVSITIGPLVVGLKDAGNMVVSLNIGTNKKQFSTRFGAKAGSGDIRRMGH